MIVISAALVLVALILLLVGLVSPDLPFVYASIAVSLLSFAFLLVGVLQRRRQGGSGDIPVELSGVGAAKAGLGALVRAGDRLRGEPDDLAQTAAVALPPVYRPGDADAELTGQVLVVVGRPRYHAEGCRYLTGKHSQSREVGAARSEGYTACGVCRPDDQLKSAAAPGGGSSASEAGDLASAVELERAITTGRAADTADLGELSAPAATSAARVTRATAKAPARPATRPASKAATKPASKPATKAAVPTKAASKAPAKAAKTASKAVSKAASKAAAPARPAAKAAPAPRAAAPSRGKVVVIPNRPKFHTADCRYVRGAKDAVELTKAAAAKQGYVPCGVCGA